MPPHSRGAFHVLVLSKLPGYRRAMPDSDDKLTPADPRDIVAALI
jgi:hypothetical protein